MIINTTKARILYVDDEPANLKTFKFLFKKYYNIFLAENGVEALDILAQRDIHVLITDRVMPEMDGVELIEKASKLYPFLKIFMLTVHKDIDSIIKVVNNGRLDGYFSPFQVDDIKNKIDIALEDCIRIRKEKEIIKKIEAKTEELDKKSELIVKKIFYEVQAEKILLDIVSQKKSIIVINQNSEIIFQNKSAEKVLGYTLEELQGKSLQIFISEKNKNYKSYLKECMDNPKSYTLGVHKKIYAVKKNGETIQLLISLSPLKIQGKIIVFIYLKENKEEEEK